MIVRSRSLLATTAVAAVLAYGLAGHSLPQMSSHDGMVGAAAGLCLLLVTIVRVVAAPPPAPPPPALTTEAPLLRIASPFLRPIDGRARASPAVLQRYRN